MDRHNDEANLELDLALALNDYKPKVRDDNRQSNNKRALFLDLSIPVHTSARHGMSYDSRPSLKLMGKDVMNQGTSKDGVSSDGCRDGDDDDDDHDNKFSLDFNCRKKLRLTRDQTTLLEDSFKQQTTLNMAQKQALAEKLNLKPRQVEVWFQNRRARTKLKQTEVDCEFLKKNCERLSEENWRLKKELLELRSSVKIAEKPPLITSQFLHHNPTTAAAAAHERNEKNRGGGENTKAATEMVHQT